MVWNLLITLGVFVLMEGVAWFTHKYVMHGFLWILHRDHHKKDHDSFFELNDFFFLIFAIPGIICSAVGMSYDFNFLFFVGLGITLYGMAYFFIHDLFIHQRLKVLKNTKNKYFLALRRAHKLHHKHLQAENGEYFGMLYIPKKFFDKKNPESTQFHTRN